MFTFAITPFDALSLTGLYDILHLRDLVFVVGQKITCEPEVDGLDPAASHVEVRDEAGRLVATARVFLGESPIIVGRGATRPDLQRSGVGTWMMQRLGEWLGDRPALLHAQAHLEDWYARLGWTRCSDTYLEAEIPHVSMRRPKE